MKKFAKSINQLGNCSIDSMTNSFKITWLSCSNSAATSAKLTYGISEYISNEINALVTFIENGSDSIEAFKCIFASNTALAVATSCFPTNASISIKQLIIISKLSNLRRYLQISVQHSREIDWVCNGQLSRIFNQFRNSGETECQWALKQSDYFIFACK